MVLPENTLVSVQKDEVVAECPRVAAALSSRGEGTGQESRNVGSHSCFIMDFLCNAVQIISLPASPLLHFGSELNQGRSPSSLQTLEIHSTTKPSVPRVLRQIALLVLTVNTGQGG